MTTETIYNPTNVTNFLIQIPDGKFTQGFTLNAQAVTLPSIQIPVTNTPSGQYGLARSSLPGTSIEFDPLQIRFLVDENLDSYLSVYEWMLSINDYLGGNSTAWDASMPEAVQVHVLDNSKRNIVATFNFYGAWPSVLGDLEYSYAEDTDTPVTCVATLHYKYYDVERNGRIIKPRRSIATQQQERVETMMNKHPRLRNRAG